METKTVVRFERVGTYLKWVDQDTGAVMFSFRMSEIDPAIRDEILSHGIQQIIAGRTGCSLADMKQRARDLVAGTWKP
jgi:hypothetical protein